MAHLFEVDLENRNQSLYMSEMAHEMEPRHDDLPQKSAQTLNETDSSSLEHQ